MKKKLILDMSFHQITYNNGEIEAHWNHFDSFQDAETYLETELVKFGQGTYGIVKIHKTFWGEVC
jgi:hypothetical protein